MNAKAPVIVASPEELARAARDELRARGFRVRVLAPSMSSVEDLAREYVALASTLNPRCAVVRTAEPSIVVPWRSATRGGGAQQPRRRGGRSTHVAALVGRSLPRGSTFLAAATDGVDGASETAGAIVEASFRDVVSLPAIDEAIEAYDTGALHLRAGTALPLRPTGHNLADLHILVTEG
jgi:hydroxypyruvate reductase